MENIAEKLASRIMTGEIKSVKKYRSGNVKCNGFAYTELEITSGQFTILILSHREGEGYDLVGDINYKLSEVSSCGTIIKLPINELNKSNGLIQTINNKFVAYQSDIDRKNQDKLNELNDINNKLIALL